jgi:hypothetical protein
MKKEKGLQEKTYGPLRSSFLVSEGLCFATRSQFFIFISTALSLARERNYVIIEFALSNSGGTA